MPDPIPVVYKYSFSDLPVQIEWLEKSMGYAKGETPEAIRSVIEEIFFKAPMRIDIQGGYVILDKIEFKDKNHIHVNDLDFHTGKIISGRLRKSEKLAFFVMTAGIGIEKWSKERMSKGDPLDGYIIDMLGSEIVESAVNLMQNELEKKMEKQGYHLSNRYSPGYCGWLVQEQQKLFTLFPENFCGITLSESSLMIPIKSVSGVIGIGADIKKMTYDCKMCDMENCIYRDKKNIV